MDIHPSPIDLLGSLKHSDDDLFGGSTTAESLHNCGENMDFSSSDDMVSFGRHCQPTQMMVPNMPGMAIMSPTMAMPMQMPSMPSMPSMPVGCAMPTTPTQSQLQPQMYFMTMTPEGSQVLMPMPASQVSSWNGSASPSNVPAADLGFAEFPTEAGNAGSLEARAAALSAYAAQVKAEARKAKAAAAAAVRRGRTSANVAPNLKSERTSSDLSGTNSDRWADVTDMAALKHYADDEEIPNDDRTTLMFRNLPNNYNRSTLLNMLDSEGLKGTYNLVYLPTDFRNFAGFGYAFVNFASHAEAKQAKLTFQGFSRWRVPSRKTCDVVWSGPVQGLQAHTERYRNSPVMHDSVPDEYKPAVFVEGVRVPFPAPTKRIRPPRVRRNSVTDGCGIAAPLPDHISLSKRTGRGKV